MKASYQPMALDLFMILTVVLVLVTAVLGALTRQEVLTYIRSQTVEAQTDPAAPSAQQSAKLEVEWQAEGRWQFIYRSPDGQKQSLNDYAGLLDLLDAQRPGDLWLRVDGRVPSRVYQKLIIDAEARKVRTWQWDLGGPTAAIDVPAAAPLYASRHLILAGRQWARLPEGVG